MENNSINFVKARHGNFLHYNYDEFVGLSIREYGEWSELLLKKIISFLNDSDFVFDIGSHIGTFTIPISKKIGENGKVFSFEPQKMLYYLQAGNLALNDIYNVELKNFGLARKKETRLIEDFDYSQLGNFGGVTFTKEYDNKKFTQIRSKKLIPTHMINLDEFLHIEKCNLIKMEAELLELEIIKGGGGFLKKFRPILVVENDPLDPTKLNKLLMKKDYKLFWFSYHFFNQDNFFINSENYFKLGGKFYIFCFPREYKINSHNIKNMEEITCPEQKCYGANKNKI